MLLALASCAAGVEEAALEAELGAGETEFAELAKDDTLPYVAGAQGGHHVYVSFRASGLDPERVLVSVETSVEDHDELKLRRQGRVDFAADGGEHYVYAGWPAQILRAPCHRGERALIRVELTDREARSVELERWIRIGEGPEPSATLCAQ